MELSTASISSGKMFWPLAERIMVLQRPLMKMFPSLSITPRSPVLRNPSSVKAFCEASGLLKYPMQMFEPLAWISPMTFSGSGESMRTSAESTRLPQDPGT